MPFSIERNDLARVEADAIIVAANEHLQITGGVGLAVAKAAGFTQMQEACNEIGFCPCGSAVVTPAFGLPAQLVIHAVGPVWQGGEHHEVALLRSAYLSAFECAAVQGAKTIALSLISAGTYGFPADVSLAVARDAIRSFLDSHEDASIRLVLFTRNDVSAGLLSYGEIASYIDNHYVGEHRPRHLSTLRDGGGYAGDSTGAYIGAGADVLVGDNPDEVLAASSVSAGEAEDAFLREACAPDYSAAPTSYVAPSMPASTPLAPSAASAPSQAQKPNPLSRLFGRSSRGASQSDTAIPAASSRSTSAAPQRLEDLLATLDASFSTTLLTLIDNRGLTDAQVYKRANMSRQLFSKIRSDAAYRPTKRTVLALAIALNLTLDETSDLLSRAGFALSHANKADVIVEYFIRRGNPDIFEVNEALYAFDQPLL